MIRPLAAMTALFALTLSAPGMAGDNEITLKLVTDRAAGAELDVASLDGSNMVVLLADPADVGLRGAEPGSVWTYGFDDRQVDVEVFEQRTYPQGLQLTFNGVEPDEID